jgi:hypothetical protein
MSETATRGILCLANPSAGDDLFAALCGVGAEAERPDERTIVANGRERNLRTVARVLS